MVTLTHVNELRTMQQAVKMAKGAGWKAEWVYAADHLDAFIIMADDFYLYIDTMSGEIRKATDEEYNRFCIEG